MTNGGCPCCNATLEDTVKVGVQQNKSGAVQRRRCNLCGYKFNQQNMSSPRGNPVLIIVVIDLHMRGLSSREIAEHLNGIYRCNVDHVTVHRWIKKSLYDLHGLTWTTLDYNTKLSIGTEVVKRRNDKAPIRLLRQSVTCANILPQVSP